MCGKLCVYGCHDGNLRGKHLSLYVFKVYIYMHTHVYINNILMHTGWNTATGKQEFGGLHHSSFRCFCKENGVCDKMFVFTITRFHHNKMLHPVLY